MDVIRRLTLIAEAQGYDEAAKKLGALGKAQEALGVSSANAEKANTTLARSLERDANRFDPVRQAVSKLEEVQTRWTRGLTQGAVSQQQFDKVIGAHQQAVLRAADAQDTLGHSSVGNIAATQALFHSFRSVAEQVALGISPFQALTGQMSHLSFVMSQEGGLSGRAWRARLRLPLVVELRDAVAGRARRAWRGDHRRRAGLARLRREPETGRARPVDHRPRRRGDGRRHREHRRSLGVVGQGHGRHGA
jgi:hypothetical protein